VDPANVDTTSMLVSEATIGFVQVGAGGRKLLGSGTLVSALGSRAILTARVVIDHLPREDRLGLAVWTDLNQISLDTADLTYKTVRGDLGLVLLSTEAIRRLSAYKRFVFLNGEGPAGSADGAWWINGFTSELTTTDLPIDCFDIVQGYTNVTAAHLGSMSPSRASRDIELTVSRVSNPEEPMAFDGLVGGGLWRVQPHSRSGEFSGVVLDGPGDWGRSGTVRCAGPAALEAVIESLIA
jgi:hypothetical protein